MEMKISTRDQIDWSLFPLSKSFYQDNINIRHERYPPSEPLWKVLKDRSDKGLMIRNILPEDSRTVLLEEFKKFKAHVHTRSKKCCTSNETHRLVPSLLG